MALTAKQERFVQEYLVDLNATQAAIRAGYSPKTAYSMGQRLLKNVEVHATIQKALKSRQVRTGITQDIVVEELAKIGLAEAHDYADADLKYSNKLKALELLGKHLGLFEGRGGQPDRDGNNLLEAIQNAGEVNADDLPEAE